MSTRGCSAGARVCGRIRAGREPLVLMLEWHVLLAHRSRPSKHRAPEDGTVVQQADGTAQRERDGSEGAQTSRRGRQGL